MVCNFYQGWSGIRHRYWLIVYAWETNVGVWEVSEKHGTETGEVMGDSDMGRIDMTETRWQVMA